MATSSPQHTINRRSGRIFESILPDHWISRSQEGKEDYGVDFEVEFTNEKTGYTSNQILKIQLKGTSKSYKETIALCQQNKLQASFNLSKRELEDAYNLNIPMFLVYVFIPDHRIFWVNIHKNDEIKTFLNEQENESKTISLPYEFKLDENNILTKDSQQIFQEQYRTSLNYIWHTRSEMYDGFSDAVLNLVELESENKLFRVLIEKLNRKLDVHEELTSEEAERLYYFYLSAKTIDLGYMKDSILNILDRTGKSEFASKLHDLSLPLLDTSNADLNDKQKYLKEIIYDTENLHIIEEEDEREYKEKENEKYEKICENCDGNVTIDNNDYKNHYFDCGRSKCQDEGTNILCKKNGGHIEWINNDDFDDKGQCECPNCDKVIKIDRFKSK